MSEETETETLNSTQTSATIAILPNRDVACDNHTAMTSATVEKMSPNSYDSESLHKSQVMVKKSLKLDLTHNNNDIKSIDTGSPINEDDLSFKSPSSPRTCKS